MSAASRDDEVVYPDEELAQGLVAVLQKRGCTEASVTGRQIRARLGDRSVYLLADRIFDDAQQVPADNVLAFLDEKVGTALATRKVEWADAVALLRPVLRPLSFTTALAVFGDDRPYALPTWPLVYELAVIDHPDLTVLVQPSDVEAWGVAPTEPFTVARRNIAAMYPSDQFERDDVLSLAGDGNMSAAALSDGMFIPGRLVFFPDANTLVIAPESVEGIEGMFALAEKLYQDAPQPVSPQAYRASTPSAQPLDLIGPHPLRNWALRARAVHREYEYRTQTSELKRSYEDAMVEYHPGELQLTDTPFGARSVTVWGEGIPWDLPEADYLTLANVDRSVAFTVPFTVAVDIAGLQPLDGVLMPRYRAPRWPSQPTLEALRAHAVGLR